MTEELFKLRNDIEIQDEIIKEHEARIKKLENEINKILVVLRAERIL